MRKLPRNIHRLHDGRFWVYTPRRGRPVRNIVTWELLTKLKVPVAAGTRSLHPGLQLAKLALTRLQGVRLEERRSGAIDASAKVKISGLLPLMEADYLHQGFKSWDDAKARWEHHLQKPFGEMLPSEITTDALSAYVKKRLGEEAEPGTVNRELSVLRRMLKLGHAAGKVQSVVAFPHLKETNIRQGFIEQCEYDLLAAQAHDVGIRGMLATGYAFGFWRGELLSLRVRQVDLANGTIILDRSQCKNDRVKLVCMTSEVKNILSLCVQGKEPGDAVFTWQDGRQIRDFRETWRRLFVDAKLPPRLFHDLRRSAVRNMVQRGVDRDTAKKISGHATDSIFSRYNIVSLENFRAAAVKISAGATGANGGSTDNAPDVQPQPEAKVQ